MPITFLRGSWHAVQAAKNAQALRLSQGLNVGMPVSEAHMVMAFAHALGTLGHHIGVGHGEVAPDRALAALTDGLRQTRQMAQRDLREQSAAHLAEQRLVD